MGNVVALRPKERVRQNGEAIAVIYRSLGTTMAEQLVTQALAELALTMTGLHMQVRAHQLADLSRRLRKLQQMADGLGMVSLASVAIDLRVCLERNDSTAFSAVWARLIRVAERCLAMDKGLADFSQQ